MYSCFLLDSLVIVRNNEYFCRVNSLDYEQNDSYHHPVRHVVSVGNAVVSAEP